MYTHTHTHTYIYIYIYIYAEDNAQEVIGLHFEYANIKFVLCTPITYLGGNRCLN